jgi:mannose-6-phosphate isomerase-like protein (cupin superfamily)
MKSVLLTASMLTLTLSAVAQSGGKSEVFASPQIRAQLQALDTKAQDTGSSGVTLADYGSHKLQLSVRTTSGGAEIHAHYDDVMIVQQGSATIVTGGTVANSKAGPDGETKGTGIEGGTSRTISQGDIVTVNAGIPHQILVTPGTTYSALVIKVREP